MLGTPRRWMIGLVAWSCASLGAVAAAAEVLRASPYLSWAKGALHGIWWSGFFYFVIVVPQDSCRWGRWKRASTSRSAT